MDKQINPMDPQSSSAEPAKEDDKSSRGLAKVIRTMRRRLGHAAWSDVTIKHDIARLDP